MNLALRVFNVLISNDNWSAWCFSAWIKYSSRAFLLFLVTLPTTGVLSVEAAAGETVGCGGSGDSGSSGTVGCGSRFFLGRPGLRFIGGSVGTTFSRLALRFRTGVFPGSGKVEDRTKSSYYGERLTTWVFAFLRLLATDLAGTLDSLIGGANCI